MRAHLVCYYRAAGRTGICRNHDAAIKETADNGCSCAGGLGKRDTLGVEGRIAVVVGEVEAAHGGDVVLLVCERVQMAEAASSMLQRSWKMGGAESKYV